MRTKRISVTAALLGTLFVSLTEANAAKPPAAPSNLVATALSTNRVRLAWTDNSKNEQNFGVERSTTGPSGTFSEIGTAPLNATAYDDVTVQPNRQYSYRVRAKNSTDGNSGYSNVASVTTP